MLKGVRLAAMKNVNEKKNKTMDALANNFGYKSLVGQVCTNLIDLTYLTSDGKAKDIKKGRKMTVFRVFGDKFILRWGSKMFIADRNQIEF